MTRLETAVSRRHVITAGATGAILLCVAPGTAAQQQNTALAEIDRKFYADGRVHPFAGNTVICHLDQQGERAAPFDTLLDFYRMVPVRSYARKIVLLPPSSYHMTIFGGANDFNREPNQWPAGIPATAPISAYNRIVADRIKAARIATAGPIRMKVDTRDSGFDGNTLRMPLTPADDGEATKLRVLRTRLADAVGIHSPRQDQYQFHVTLAYLVGVFTPTEKRDALADMAEWKQRLIDRSPTIELGRPEYCTFKDMFSFNRQFFL